MPDTLHRRVLVQREFGLVVCRLEIEHDLVDGQLSKGPAAPCTLSGVRCHLPNPPVTYPFSLRIRGSAVQLLGRTAVYPGKGPGYSAIEPNPTRWWLRPVRSPARVGEHTEVT